MARKPRVDFEGYIYHVMCRGNNGEYIFKDDKDKKLYLDILKRFKKKYDFLLYGYCIMDNHIDLLIYRRTVSLSKFMGVIQQTFTQHYNKKYGRKGHVFQQRFKSIPCREDEYLMRLVYYIHMNPVRAQIEEGIDYKWSSHRIYSKGLKGSIVDTDFVYSMLGDDFKEALKGYNSYMGTKRDFKSNFYKNYSLDQKTIDEIIIKNQKKEIRPELEEIIKMVCYEYGESDVSIIYKRTGRKAIQMRKAVIILTEYSPYIKNKDIAKALCISDSSIIKTRSRTSIADGECKSVVEKIRSYYL